MSEEMTFDKTIERDLKTQKRVDYILCTQIL